MSHGFNKKASPIVALHPFPLPGLLFYKNYLSTYFSSDQVIAKNSYYLLLVDFDFAILFICVS